MGGVGGGGLGGPMKIIGLQFQIHNLNNLNHIMVKK